MMRYMVDHDLHIHSYISPCSSDAEQTPENMMRYAIENGYNKICVTDHFWDPLIDSAYGYVRHLSYSDLARIKPLPQVDNVQFLFGCETDMDCLKNLGLSKSCAEKFDFIVVATTHFHMKGDVLAEEELLDNNGRARAWIDRIDRLLDMDMPFNKMGLAHLTTHHIAQNKKDLLYILRCIPSSELQRVFENIAQKGMGIELNAKCMHYEREEQEIFLRPYRIAKECGCKFYCGSDAHHLVEFNHIKSVLQREADLLQLEEKDKFILS